MKKLIPICLMLCLTLSAGAQEPAFKVIGLYNCGELPKQDLLSLDGESVYKIENTNDSASQVALLKILEPRVSNAVYAVIGRVKYENVQGEGYLEMWNYFPPLRPGLPEGQYFSRTLGDSGPMSKITGTSDWRDFSLLFDPAGASGPPTRLEINIRLPGRGTVYLSPVKLIQYDNSLGSAGAAPASGWWSAEVAPWVGGIGGPVIGCFGGLLGWLSLKGKARQLVLATWKGCIAFGIICLMATTVALMVKQPWYVVMPLAVFGVVSTAVFLATWPNARRRYDELEIRRMTSMDATGSS